MSEPTPNCPRCHNPKGKHSYHSIECPQVTLEDALYRARAWKESAARWQDNFKRQRDEAQRWEGKFRVVKHENNQLRRKLGVKYPAMPSDIHQTTP